MKEHLLYPPQVWRYDRPGGDEGRMVVYEIYEAAMRERHVGDHVTAYAAAPGYGYVTHRITRMDASGIYAVEVANTIAELTEADVR